MKKIFVFSTRLWYFISLIPVLSMLALVISVHDTAPTIVKYYPLEIALAALAVLIILFFFRAVLISKDEIRQLGRFTPREKAFIEEGKTLVFTLAEKKRMTIELFEASDGAPALPWAATVAGEINLFRARAIGDARTVRRVLCLFGVCASDADALLAQPPKKEVFFDNISVRSEEKNDALIYYLKILQTL